MSLIDFCFLTQIVFPAKTINSLNLRNNYCFEEMVQLNNIEDLVKI